ncbi:hypothetical protein ABKN59_006298 [Abortiporus biennis]
MFATFNDLPAELVVATLENLDGGDLVHCCLVSRRLHLLVRKSERLQYLIELKMDISRNQSPTYHFVEKIPYHQHTKSGPELRQGIFSRMILTESNQRILHCWQIPRGIFGIPYSYWSVYIDIQVKGQYHMHAIDPSQDLLFIVHTYRSGYFGTALSLTTGQPHDLVIPSQKHVPIFKAGRDKRRAHSLTILGESVFAITTRQKDSDIEDCIQSDDAEHVGDESDDSSKFKYDYVPGCRFSIVQFNWRTSEPKMDKLLQLPMQRHQDKAYFRAHYNAVVLNESHLAISTILYEKKAEQMVNIDIVDLELLRQGRSLRDSTLFLELPTPVVPNIILNADCKLYHDNPGTPGHWYLSSPTGPLNHPPFEISNDQAILSFSWYYAIKDDGPIVGPYNGFIPISRLIKLSSGERRTRRWEDWGACYSRAFHSTACGLSKGAIYGSKVIVAINEWNDTEDDLFDEDTDEMVVNYECLDFGPSFPSKQLASEAHADIDEVQNITTPTTTQTQLPWQQQIQMTCGNPLVTGTSLPYRRYSVNLSPPPVDDDGPPGICNNGYSILIEHDNCDWSLYTLE